MKKLKNSQFSGTLTLERFKRCALQVTTMASPALSFIYLYICACECVCLRAIFIKFICNVSVFVCVLRLRCFYQHLLEGIPSFFIRLLCTLHKHTLHTHTHTHVYAHRFVCYSFGAIYVQFTPNSLGFILYLSFLHTVALRILLVVFNMSLIGSNLATFLWLATCCIGKIAIITFFSWQRLFIILNMFIFNSVFVCAFLNLCKKCAEI